MKIKKLFSTILITITAVTMVAIFNPKLSASAVIDGWNTTAHVIEDGEHTLTTKINVNNSSVQIGVKSTIAGELSVAYSFTNPLSETARKMVIKNDKVTTYKPFGYEGSYVFLQGDFEGTYELHDNGQTLLIEIPITSFNEIYVYPEVKGFISPSGIETEVSSYIPFVRSGYKSLVKPSSIDGETDDWVTPFISETFGKKSLSYSAYIDNGLYVGGSFMHSKDDSVHVDLMVGKTKYPLMKGITLYNAAIFFETKKEGGQYVTKFEAYIPLNTDKYVRLGIGFYSKDDTFLVNNRESDYWYLAPHNPKDITKQYYVFSDGIQTSLKGGDTFGESYFVLENTIGFDFSNDRGLSPSVEQTLLTTQTAYFKEMGIDYYFETHFDVKELGANPTRIGVIAAEDKTHQVSFIADYNTQIHLRVVINNKLLNISVDELVTFYPTIRMKNMKMAVLKVGTKLSFFVDDLVIFEKEYDINESQAGLITHNMKATFSNYFFSSRKEIISYSQQLADNKPGKTMLTVADSIFDFTDNKIADMVQNILRGSRFDHLYIDNIGGSTIAPYNDRSIVSHIKSGLYEAFPEPDIILLQRGTNDVHNVGVNRYQMGSIGSDETTLIGAVEYTMNYFRNKWPNARIIWSTSIYRTGGYQNLYSTFHEALFELGPRYNVEIFDLHTAVGIDQDNYTNYLYDGIHLNDAGKVLMQQAFIKYINGE